MKIGKTIVMIDQDNKEYPLRVEWNAKAETELTDIFCLDIQEQLVDILLQPIAKEMKKIGVSNIKSIEFRDVELTTSEFSEFDGPIHKGE